MRFWTESRQLAAILLGFAVVIAAIFRYFDAKEEAHAARFMAECQADGFKRYQCEAIRSGAQIVLCKEAP